MSSIINNQPVYIQQLDVPQVTNLNTTPSLSPILGTLAHDATDSASLYIGDGTSWKRIISSGSIGGIINGALISTSTIDGLVSLGAVDSMLTGSVVRYTFSVTTTDAIQQFVLNIPIIGNRSTALKVTANAYCTAGTNITGGLSRVVYSSVRSISGTATLTGSATIMSVNSTGLNTADASFAVSGFDAYLTITGVTGNTLVWSGYVEVCR